MNHKFGWKGAVSSSALASQEVSVNRAEISVSNFDKSPTANYHEFVFGLGRMATAISTNLVGRSSSLDGILAPNEVNAVLGTASGGSTSSTVGNNNGVGGIAGGKPQMRIVNGAHAAPGAFPWQLQLQRNRKKHCGATLISKKWALTAAHCIT